MSGEGDGKRVPRSEGGLPATSSCRSPPVAHFNVLHQMEVTLADTPSDKLAATNHANKLFWEHESGLALQRARDPATLETAVSILASEERRGIATHDQLTVEAALESADSAKGRFRPALISEIASKAGRASKGDGLTKIILSMVKRDPDLALPALLDRLAAMQGPGLEIEEINDTTITLSTRNDGIKEVPISGLKDRLSRAKRKARGQGTRSTRT